MKMTMEQLNKRRTRNRETARKWREANPDKKKAYARMWYLKNRDKEIVRVTLWKKNNPDRARDIQRKYLATNTNYRLASYWRSRLWDTLYARGIPKTNNMENLLGTSIANVRSYLESQFAIGMSWNNHGMWHIDHIKPLASFDLTKRSEQKKAFHYTNLQPLWAKDNLRKGVKLLG